MVHVVFMSLGSRGDIQPAVVVGRGLVARGHKVTIATSAIYEEMITKHDINFHQLTDKSPAAILESKEGQAMLKAGKTKEFITMLRKAFPPCFKESEEIVKQADLVVSVTFVFDTAYCLAEKYKKPFVRIGLIPLVPTRSRATVFALKKSFPVGFLNMLSHLMVDLSWWTKSRKALFNDWRQNVLQLPPIANIGGPMPIIVEQDLPYCLAISPAVWPKPSDWRKNDNVTGYLFWDSKDKANVPDGLENFLNAGEAPAYIGFGSMHIMDVPATMKLIIESLARTNNRAVLCMGWNDKSKLGEIKLPDTVFLCSQVPHAWLFPKCKLVVHHGGAGTIAAGLRAGMPTVVCSFFADQPFWGHQMSVLGVGTTFPFNDITADKLVTAIELVQQPKVVAAAAKLGEQVRKDGDGVDTMCDKLLEYQKKGCVPKSSYASTSTFSILFSMFGRDIMTVLVVVLALVYYFVA